MNTRQVAVVLPAYNEQENLPNVVGTIVGYLDQNVADYHIIIVNDGSKDQTGKVAQSLSQEFPGKIVVVHHSQNKGYGATIRTGFETALETGMEWVFFTDSDGQFDISDLEKLFQLAEAKQASIVAGYRMNRADPLIRKINGIGWTIVSCVLLGLWIKDIDCAFKLIHRHVFESIGPLKGEAATINPELLYKAKKRGFRIVQTGVHHYPRMAGHQTGAKLSVILRSFMSLIRLRLGHY